jgi:TldD protein
VDGAWGFASTSTPERAAIRNAVEQAIESARALARAGARKVEPLPATELASADHVGEGYEELLALSIGDKLSRTVELEKATLAASSRVHTAAARYTEVFEEKTIVTTDGAAASYRLVRPEVSVRAFAEKDGSQVVCANAVGVTGGWQCLFHHPNAVAITERTAARAVELLDAPPRPGAE